MRIPPWIAYAFLAPALAGLLLFRVVPIFIALVGSLFGTSLMGDSVFRGLGNYSGLANDPDFWNSVRVTLTFNLIVNPLQVVVAFLLALLMARPGRFVGPLRTALVLPITVSIALTSVLWNILLDPGFGPVNGLLRALSLPPQPFFRAEHQSLATLIAVCTWRGAGYWMLFMLAGLGAIPPEVNEAASIDGVKALQRLRFITLPLMRRTLAFVLIADTAVNFLLFAPVYVITNGGPAGSTALLMFEAYRAAFTYLDSGRSLAISSVILIIIAAVAALEMRFFQAQDSA